MPSERNILQYSPAIDAAPIASENNVGKLAFIVVFAAILAALVLFHVPGINGTAYWPWHYRRIEWWRIHPAMLIATIPAYVAWKIISSPRIRITAAIVCMMISCFAMQIVVVGMGDESFNIGRIAQLVNDKMTTSYFTDATLLAAQPSVKPFLAQYDRLLPSLTFHSREKPPGPVLYYTFLLRMLNNPNQPGDAALLGGIVIGLLATLSIPATFLFVRLITHNTRAALIAALYFSIAPCLVVFFPMFDQIYPIFSCAMLGLWVLAMRDRRWWAAVAFAAVLSVACFFSYAMLVVGAWVVGYALLRIREAGKPAIENFIVQSFIVVISVAAIYGLLWLATGFNPFATFRAAAVNQGELLAHLVIPRPWPNTIPADFQDFFLGSAWVSLPLIIFWILRLRLGAGLRDEIGVRSLAWLGLAQIALVALTGLLPAETSRVWMFLQPLALTPVALELARWKSWQCGCVLAIVAAITAIAAQNMIFLAG
jgi:hypothetical protein